MSWRKLLLSSAIKEREGWIKRKGGSGHSRQAIVTKVDMNVLWEIDGE